MNKTEQFIRGLTERALTRALIDYEAEEMRRRSWGSSEDIRQYKDALRAELNRRLAEKKERAR